MSISRLLECTTAEVSNKQISSIEKNISFNNLAVVTISLSPPSDSADLTLELSDVPMEEVEQCPTISEPSVPQDLTLEAQHKASLQMSLAHFS